MLFEKPKTLDGSKKRRRLKLTAPRKPVLFACCRSAQENFICLNYKIALATSNFSNFTFLNLNVFIKW